MLTVYITRHEHAAITVDGRHHKVKAVLIEQAGEFVTLQDYEPDPDLREVKLTYPGISRRFEIEISEALHSGIVSFLKEYHAQQNISFDCYSFVNLVHGHPQHEKLYAICYWDIVRKPFFLKPGSVLFFCSKKQDRFHHAAIYLGHGICISVYGAGGDLEVSTIPNMKRDFGAEAVFLAKPKPN